MVLKRIAEASSKKDAQRIIDEARAESRLGRLKRKGEYIKLW